MTEQKITFKQLDWWLKAAIIGGWFTLLVYGGAFMLGFIKGLIGG